LTTACNGFNSCRRPSVMIAMGFFAAASHSSFGSAKL
jgi:hypothetical protein